MSPDVIADALDALSHLCATEGSVRGALISWPRRAPREISAPLERLSARLTMGAPISYVLPDLRAALGPSTDVLIAIVRLHLGTGADASTLLASQAKRTRAEAEVQRRSAAGLAGIRASARLMAGLPIACLVLLPMDRSPLADPTGLAVLGAGLVLCAAGFLWIRRSIPRPQPGGDAIAGVCDLMAGAIRAGSPPPAALEVAACSTSGPVKVALERVLRLVRLGSRLPRALDLAGDGMFADLAAVIDRSAVGGTPLAPALEALARRRRAVSAAEMERAIRAAPIRMLPALALCVLPSFALLGLGPFVRDLLRVL